MLVLGMPAVALELALLEHWEEWQQWLPLAILAVGLVSTVAVLRRPGGRTIRLFRAVMGAFVATGLLGLYFHYRGNAEFELEMDATLEGVALFRKAIMGATPALAPGTLSYMGLLGLIAVWRHPSGADPGGGSEAREETATPELEA